LLRAIDGYAGREVIGLASLLNRRHPNIAAVALANKNVRTVWALLAHGRDFKPDYVPVRATA
jgi:transposase